MGLKIPDLVIKNSQAQEVNFADAILHRAQFQDSDFHKALFNKTNLTEANFQDAKNYSISIKENTLKKATFSLPEAISLLETLDIKLT